MKKQMRSCMFETNSSSTHSLIIMPKDLFNSWAIGADKYLIRKCDFKELADSDLPEVNVFSKNDTLVFIKHYLPDLYEKIEKTIDEILNNYKIFNYETFYEKYDIVEDKYKVNNEEIIGISYFGYDN